MGMLAAAAGGGALAIDVCFVLGIEGTGHHGIKLLVTETAKVRRRHRRAAACSAAQCHRRADCECCPWARGRGTAARGRFLLPFWPGMSGGSGTWSRRASEPQAEGGPWCY